MRFHAAARGELFRRQVLPQLAFINAFRKFQGAPRRDVSTPAHYYRPGWRSNGWQLGAIGTGDDDAAVNQQHSSAACDAQGRDHRHAGHLADKPVIPIDCGSVNKFPARDDSPSVKRGSIRNIPCQFEFVGIALRTLAGFNHVLLGGAACLPVPQPSRQPDEHKCRYKRQRLQGRSLTQAYHAPGWNGHNADSSSLALPGKGFTHTLFSMKIIVVLILLVILGSMASALVFLVKDGGKTRRGVRALTVRISLSVALFLLLLFGYYMGWFVPNQRPF